MSDLAEKRFAHGIDVTVYCTVDGYRDRPARYKIAAVWKAGDLTGLKTFGFADDDCLDSAFGQGLRSAAAVRYGDGESLGPMGVYRLAPNVSDLSLERLEDLEADLRRRWTAYSI